LAQESIKNMLKDLGVTETEVEVYVFLCKNGALKGTDLSRLIKKDKAQIYHLLRSLETKGLVEVTLEAHPRFSPVDLSKVIELAIEVKKNEITRIKMVKKNLMSTWKDIQKQETDQKIEKFSIIEGRIKIFNKIEHIMSNTKRELLVATTIENLLRAMGLGLYDSAVKRSNRFDVQLRFLAEFNHDYNCDINGLMKKINKAQFRFRDINSDLMRFPMMVIKDNDEAIIFMTPKGTISADVEELCFWTDCKDIVHAFSGVFNVLWQHSLTSDILNQSNSGSITFIE
jgi:sugar-specific transcriptional regulator TrmB